VFGLTTGGKTQGKTGQGRSAADFLPGTAAGGNFKGGTGQGERAAERFPWGHQFEKEAKANGVPTRGRQIDKEAGAHDVRGSGVESDKDSAPFEWVVAANHKAMRALADNRSFRGTSASRMAADTRAAEAAPPAWAQTMRSGYGTFRETPQIRTQTSPTEHRNGCTWWS
jgi:hypothetical protein